MKINLLSAISFFKKSKIYHSAFQRYWFSINKKLIPTIEILASKANRKTYRDLREFQSPQHDIGYVMRLKKGFNTMLFKKHYDVVICDKNGRVIETVNNIRPNFVSKYYDDAYYVYYFSVATIKFYSIKENDVLQIRMKWL